MNESVILTCILVFLSVVVPYFFASAWINSPNSGHREASSNVPAFFRLFDRFVDGFASGIQSVFGLMDGPRARDCQNEILKSGYSLVPAQVFAAQTFAATAAGMVFCFVFFVMSGQATHAIVAGFIGAFLGWVYPRMIVQKRAQERQAEIIKSLPFAIDLIASAMRAGLDFMAAVRYYVKMSATGALSVEFGLLLRQMEFGKSRMEALEEMSTHVQTPEFTSFVAAVAHGTEIGASIIDTLQIQGEDMRRARFNLAERKAARAPSIMIFPIAIFILPCVFAIVLVPVFLRFKAAKGGM